jgi:hypothetical protein
MILVMMNKISLSSFTRYWHLFPWIGYAFLLTVAVGSLRAFNLNQPLTWLLDVVLFVFGAWCSTILFVFEPKMNLAIEHIGAWLAHDETHHPQTQPLPPQTQSWLRSNTVLMLLPLLAFYLLTSSQSEVGFGFLFGISLIYGVDVWKFTRNAFPDFLQIYFFQRPSASYLQALTLGYAAYFGFFCFALILL